VIKQNGDSCIQNEYPYYPTKKHSISIERWGIRKPVEKDEEYNTIK